MANLLPTKELQDLRRTQRQLLRAGVFTLTATLFAVATLLLTPAALVLLSTRESISARLETTQRLVSLQQAESAGGTIASTKEKMSIIATISSLPAPDTLIARVTNLAPTGISLDNLAFVREEDMVEMTLSGAAASRAALLSFGDALRSSGLFTEVVIPIESLAQNTDLRFHLKLLLTDDTLTRL